MGLTTRKKRSSVISCFYISAVLMFSLLSCKPVDQEPKVKVETGAVGTVGVDFALISGKVIDTGDGQIEQHGFCYSLSKDPTIFDHITKLGSRNTVGDFSDSLLNLQSGTTYYVCAFAQANDETFYGDQSSFLTLSPTSPEVNIESVGEVQGDTVLVTSIVIDDGGSAITSRGVCWSLEQNPSLSDVFTSDGTGSGSFISTISGLMSDTVYYIRAYATSSVATSYSDQQQVSTPPGSVKIATTAISGITMNSAVSGGSVIDDGGFEITSRGVCWSTLEHPTIAEDITVDGTGSGTYTSSITGLSPGTTYFVRAYAVNALGTSYGEELSFTTTSQSASLPVLTTTAITSITDHSAAGGGNITDDGGSSISARGICWSTSHNPDLSDGFTADGSGTGSYTSAISGLSPNTTYYVRAYATNGEGTAYGLEESFTTNKELYLPTLSTAAVTSITATSAVGGGNVTDDGGSAVTARGVCWSTSENPVITADHTTDGTGAGSFTSSISGLDPNTIYYLRAYATNELGTSYGNQVSFSTSDTENLATLTTNPVTSITETSAVSGGNISDDGGSAIIARGVCWSVTTTPDLSGEYTTDGSGSGNYTSSLSGLNPNTTYYVRAYATNGEGTAFGDEISFTTNSSPSLPTVTTTQANNITAVSAKSGGVVSDDGGTTVVARGVCWSTSPLPDFTDDYSTDGSETGTFISSLLNLTPNTTYYVRAYATNGTGTAFGNEISFTSKEEGETVTDVDGNVYRTVVIGTQTWMGENLKVTHYSNGDEIPQVTDILEWTSATEGAYCYYDNDILRYKDTYGALYNWYVVEDSRNVCPSGWHVPTDLERDVLIEYAGGTSIAGAKLKESGPEHWGSANYSTDEFGFTALPGGSRNTDGSFGSLGRFGSFRTSVSYSSAWSYGFGMDTYVYSVSTGGKPHNSGASVRCIKD